MLNNLQQQPHQLKYLRYLISGYHYFLHYTPCIDGVEGNVECDVNNIINFDNIKNAPLNYPLQITSRFLHVLINMTNNIWPKRLPRLNLPRQQTNFIVIVYLNILLKVLYDGIYNNFNKKGGNVSLYNKIQIQTIILSYINNNYLNDDPFGFNNYMIKYRIMNKDGFQTNTVVCGSTYLVFFDTLKTNIHVIKYCNITTLQVKKLYIELLPFYNRHNFQQNLTI